MEKYYTVDFCALPARCDMKFTISSNIVTEESWKSADVAHPIAGGARYRESQAVLKRAGRSGTAS